MEMFRKSETFLREKMNASTWLAVIRTSTLESPLCSWAQPLPSSAGLWGGEKEQPQDSEGFQVVPSPGHPSGTDEA